MDKIALDASIARNPYEVAKPGDPFPFPLTDLIERGGQGSGHFGHEGRPGEVGGSQPSDDAEALGQEEERDLRAKQAEYEAKLLEGWGEADLLNGIWIGPSGKTLVPGGDHQATAYFLIHGNREMPRDAGMAETDAVVGTGIIRYNITRAIGYSTISFDLPEREWLVTDEQKATMAAIVTVLGRQNHGIVPYLYVGIGAMMEHAATVYEGEEAYEYLGLSSADLVEMLLGVERGGPGSGHFGPPSTVEALRALVEEVRRGNTAVLEVARRTVEVALMPTPMPEPDQTMALSILEAIRELADALRNAPAPASTVEVLRALIEEVRQGNAAVLEVARQVVEMPLIPPPGPDQTTALSILQAIHELADALRNAPTPTVVTGATAEPLDVHLSLEMPRVTETFTIQKDQSGRMVGITKTRSPSA